MRHALAMSVTAISEEVVGPTADLIVTFERILADSSEMRSERYVAITCGCLVWRRP